MTCGSSALSACAGASPPYVSAIPTIPSSLVSSRMFRSAYGACSPYELRNGGSAIAIECTCILTIRMGRKKELSKSGLWNELFLSWSRTNEKEVGENSNDENHAADSKCEGKGLCFMGNEASQCRSDYPTQVTAEVLYSRHRSNQGPRTYRLSKCPGVWRTDS